MTLKEDISKWVMDWVSVYNEQLGTVPCPFAKQALLADKIDYYVAMDLADAKEQCKLYNTDRLLIIGFDRNIVTADELTNFTADVNKDILIPAGYVALEDHPDNEEIINGAKMNQGHWALLLIQSLDKINQASLMLKQQGYYDKWPQSAIDDVVTWRFQKEKE